MTVDDKIQCRIYCVAGDQVSVNVRHFKVTAVKTGAADLDELADAMSLRIAAVYRPWLAAAARYVGVALDLYNVVPPTVGPTTSIVGQGDGTGAGDMLPRQVAALIRFKNVRNGRHGRGRSYIPFGTETRNGIGGKLDATGLATLDTIRAVLADPFKYFTPGDETTLLPCVRDKTTNIFWAIVDSVSDDRWATQKRRGSFGRKNDIPF